MGRPRGARGARGGWRLLVALGLAFLPLAAPAETGPGSEAGQAAFDRADFVAAAALWRAESEGTGDGAAAAKFGLGLIHDLGLGVPRSSAAALRWYLEAAGEGHAEAAFNVAVMLDAGTGAPRDPAAAATWYARAAARGHPRAQYNLGMLYEGGQGVPRNLDVARAWYAAAAAPPAALSAAAERLAKLPPPRDVASGQAPPADPPRPVAAALVGSGAAARVELVWTDDAGPGTFRVEVTRAVEGGQGPAAGAPPLLTAETATTALLLEGPTGGGALEGALAWRVGRLPGPGAGPAWSPWREVARAPSGTGPEPAPEVALAAAPAAEAPPRRLTIEVGADDELARAFATELSVVYARGGVEVGVRTAAQSPAATTVEFAHAGDAAFAAAVAGVLPALGPEAAVRVEGSPARPGEVTLRLVGGPRPEGGAAP